ncbi:MAG: phosphomannose isomerase type II C-terminal cupin domain [Candidatus Pacebacteria bacterium]|jgi:mannose-6-phosphate isomerase-like protein (cupin superfamily)|nr:phosphomannose isomerase type II C-terminal cupin domain [Candidatus Paceibacterota bacterium]
MKTYKEARPWGDFIRYTQNEVSTVKIITVKANEQLSLQFHHKRSEFWRILTDGGEVIVDGKATPGKKDAEYFIPAGMTHQVKGPMQFLEISLGDFDEGDIVRLEDKYNRI